jgi:hypothetical protein
MTKIFAKEGHCGDWSRDLPFQQELRGVWCCGSEVTIDLTWKTLNSQLVHQTRKTSCDRVILEIILREKHSSNLSPECASYLVSLAYVLQPSQGLRRILDKGKTRAVLSGSYSFAWKGKPEGLGFRPVGLPDPSWVWLWILRWCFIDQ